MANRMSPVLGSSPHTRGALWESMMRGIVDRIIPAYAGSTGRTSCRNSPPRDHPRIRGEHKLVESAPHDHAGSSPHTRGALGRNRALRRRRRIIPAYAGSTHKGELSLHRERDHPRIRGEHPHTLPAQQTGRGIIPAYAGSTRRNRCRKTLRTDHPRIRGEHDRILHVDGLTGGSSPHTRGALGSVPNPGSRRGIIPAYAGSTSVACAGCAAHRDHPRIRGEHGRPRQQQDAAAGSSPHTRGARLSGLYTGDGQGSSPHTRGALSRNCDSPRASGIIPAYAGSTADVIIFRSIAADHPRIRGEHERPRSFLPRSAGSSPHTRGARSARSWRSC